jgi:Fe-S cluster biosynthesis and repair protein YggX
MMADAGKIEQLKKLVEQDPNDELAQFSLGKACLDAGNLQDAGPCFQRVLAINSQNSKAYELLGSVQKQMGLTSLAIETLTNGYRVAHRKGDMMPMNAMAALLRELGAEVPAIGAKAPAASTAAGGGFTCRRCGAPGPQLERAPFKGELGDVVFKSVCQSCWRGWVAQGTKVINELRLPMYDMQAQEMYDRHMKEFLLIE